MKNFIEVVEKITPYILIVIFLWFMFMFITL